MAAWGGTLMKRILIVIIGLVTVFFFTLATSWAVTPVQLKQMLDQGDKLTIIDVRNTGLYSQGHIQGAINIPASIIAKKRLPPIGTVVVCGDGVRDDIALEAVKALNRKRGIEAEMLQGGFAAWEALNLPTAAAANADIVLVDLRSRTTSAEKSTAAHTQSPPAANRTLTDLSKKFSGHTIIHLNRKTRSPGNKWDVSSVIQTRGKGSHHRYHYVIIDDGDGEGEKVARRLFAAGVKRVAILTGGERILRRDGRAEVVRKKTSRKQN